MREAAGRLPLSLSLSLSLSLAEGRKTADPRLALAPSISALYKQYSL